MDIKKLRQRFTNLTGTATFRQSILTTSAVFINGVMGAVFFILVARILGPSDFGLFTIAIATTALIADIADFGTSTGIVKFVPGYFKADANIAYRLLKLSLEVKVIIWLSVLALGYWVSPFAAGYIFSKPELTLPLRLGLLGVGGAMLFSFTQSSLQAFERYKLWGLVNILTNGLRLAVILLLLMLGMTGLVDSLLVYIALPFLGFFLGLYFLPTGKILQVKNEIKMLKDFRSYNSYIGVFTLIAAVSARMDTYIAAKLLSTEQVGIYGAAVQLNSFIPQIMGGLGVVVAPKFASFTLKSQMVEYLKKLQLMVVGLAILFTLGLPLALFLIPFFYGQAYYLLPLIFVIYFLGMLVYLISLPVHTAVFYYYSRPQLFIYISIGHLLLVLLLGYYLTLNYGLAGLPIAVLTGMVFNFVVPLAYVLNRIRKD